MSYTKYFDIELNQMIIIENIKYKIQLLMRFLKNNQAMNFLIKNVHIHKRSKYIDVIYHYIKNSYQRNLIKLNYVSSENIIIDDLTKLLSYYQMTNSRNL